MAVVGRADMDGVEAARAEHLFVVGIDLRSRRAVLLGGFFGAVSENVAERDLLHAGNGGEAGHVLAVGDAAAPDDGNFCSRQL